MVAAIAAQWCAQGARECSEQRRSGRACGSRSSRTHARSAFCSPAHAKRQAGAASPTATATVVAAVASERSGLPDFPGAPGAPRALLPRRRSRPPPPCRAAAPGTTAGAPSAHPAVCRPAAPLLLWHTAPDAQTSRCFRATGALDGLFLGRCRVCVRHVPEEMENKQ